MVDFDALMLGPIYGSLGVPGVITLPDSRAFNVTVIDKSAGIEVGTNATVPTVAPAAAVRYSELNSIGLSLDDIVDATLAMNGFTWTIIDMKKNPNPTGEKAGDVFLILSQQTEEASSS